MFLDTFLFRQKVISAGAGKSHTVVVTEDGTSFSFGWNKHGQLGTGSVKNGMPFSSYASFGNFQVLS